MNLYTEGVLGVYELNRIELLRDVFIRAYQRSAARYVAVQQSLGEPNPFRMRYRTSLREVVGEVIRGRMDKKQATVHVGAWAREHVDLQECERFREVAERELLGLHEGNFARYPGQAIGVRGLATRLEPVKGRTMSAEVQRLAQFKVVNGIVKLLDMRVFDRALDTKTVCARDFSERALRGP